MGVTVVTPPTWPLVPVEELKSHLNIDFDDDNALLELYLETISEQIDGPSGDLNRAVSPQVLLLTVDCFPRDGIELPYPPCTSVDWVKYTDPLGVEQTLSTDVYETATEGKYTWVRRQFEQEWPEVRRHPGSVSIQFQCGPATLSKRDRQAIYLMGGDLYENRASQVIDQGRAVLIANPTVDRLLKRDPIVK